MNDIVFREWDKLDDEPITWDVTAEFAGVQHHTITRLIEKLEDAFPELEVVRFEIEKPEKGSRVGRLEISYHSNEEQATLLACLKNIKRVRASKRELVRQFYAMRKELQK